MYAKLVSDIEYWVGYLQGLKIPPHKIHNYKEK